MAVYAYLPKLAFNCTRAWRMLRMRMMRPTFSAYGANFRFDPSGSYTPECIRVGHDVNLGYRPILWAVAPAYIEIWNKVIFGPRVTIIAGDHVIDDPTAFIADIKNKRAGDDLPVIIESDVWIGANATILKGVRVGRGSVIAAGSVVTHSIEPYSVVAGVPARKVRERFTPAVIANRESHLSYEMISRPHHLFD